MKENTDMCFFLRDLPPTGRHWQPYFHRTFEIYTRLWRFQQTHREALDNPEVYGLKRWEIGEIASKIGQLYYHYYLRTSETNYLYESYIFYEAIRDRLYFNEVLGTGNAALMVKKLRYYARFIVVCLLLNMNDMIKALIEELTLCIEQYTNTYRQPDSAEWNVVLSEIATFMEVIHSILTQFSLDSHCILFYRLRGDWLLLMLKEMLCASCPDCRSRIVCASTRREIQS